MSVWENSFSDPTIPPPDGLNRWNHHHRHRILQFLFIGKTKTLGSAEMWKKGKGGVRCKLWWGEGGFSCVGRSRPYASSRPDLPFPLASAAAAAAAKRILGIATKKFRGNAIPSKRIYGFLFFIFSISSVEKLGIEMIKNTKEKRGLYRQSRVGLCSRERKLENKYLNALVRTHMCAPSLI